MTSPKLESVLARKLEAVFPLNPKELGWLAGIQAAPITVKRGRRLTQEGQTGHKAFVFHEGWAFSFKDLFNGQRQIISFPIPGDCVGLRSILLRTADHSFEALTDVVVSPVEGAHFMKCLTDNPRLGAAFLWASSNDEAMVVEHLVSVGRRSAIERTAHLFMEVAERLNLVGFAKGTAFEFPLSQLILADTLGLTPIHINRVMRQLRELRLLTLKKGVAVIHDISGLSKIAGFSGGYLNVTN
jgi:CRP-like cAMP-binding protein